MQHSGFYGVFKGKTLQTVEGSPDMAVFAIKNLAPNGDKWTEENPGDWRYAPVVVFEPHELAATIGADIRASLLTAAGNVLNRAADAVEANPEDAGTRRLHASAVTVFDAAIEGAGS